jgi:hypothetical protein
MKGVFWLMQMLYNLFKIGYVEQKCIQKVLNWHKLGESSEESKIIFHLCNSHNFCRLLTKQKLAIKKEDNFRCPLFVGDDGFEPPTLWV